MVSFSRRTCDVNGRHYAISDTAYIQIKVEDPAICCSMFMNAANVFSAELYADTFDKCFMMAEVVNSDRICVPLHGFRLFSINKETGRGDETGIIVECVKKVKKKRRNKIMLTDMNGKYADVGEVVIFPDGRFNYQQDSEGKTLSKEPGTAGMAFVAVRQKDKDTCEAFFDSRRIERTLASRPNLMAGSFALDSIFVTRSEYLYHALFNGQVYIWQRHEWMVKRDGLLIERPNSDLWEDLIDILNDFKDIGIEVETKYLEKDNYSVLNTLVENLPSGRLCGIDRNGVFITVVLRP